MIKKWIVWSFCVIWRKGAGEDSCRFHKKVFQGRRIHGQEASERKALRRRDFIKTSLIGVAGVATGASLAPTILRGSAEADKDRLFRRQQRAYRHVRGGQLPGDTALDRRGEQEGRDPRPEG